MAERIVYRTTAYRFKLDDRILPRGTIIDPLEHPSRSFLPMADRGDLEEIRVTEDQLAALLAEQEAERKYEAAVREAEEEKEAAYRAAMEEYHEATKVADAEFERAKEEAQFEARDTLRDAVG